MGREFKVILEKISKINLLEVNGQVVFQKDPISISSLGNTSCKKSFADRIPLKKELDTNSRYFYKKTWQ